MFVFLPGLAYALLAGVDPINGMYTAFFSPLVYTFLGTSSHISVGEHVKFFVLLLKFYLLKVLINFSLNIGSFSIFAGLYLYKDVSNLVAGVEFLSVPFN